MSRAKLKHSKTEQGGLKLYRFKSYTTKLINTYTKRNVETKSIAYLFSITYY